MSTEKGTASKEKPVEEAPAEEAPVAEATSEEATEEPQPSESTASDGSTSFLPERLIRDAEGLLGVPQHVAAGALSTLEPSTYLTVEDATAKVEEFLATEA
jgi:hypothetical protein